MTEIEHIGQLTPDPANARRHTPRNVGMIETALSEVGAARSIVIDEDGVILAGNATVEAAAQAGIERVQVVEADGETIIAVRRRGLTAEQKTRLALFDNRTAELAEWDAGVLASLSEELDLSSLFHPDELAALLEQAGTDILDSADTTPTQARATLAERFGVPPFSVLDARQGYWQARKRAWIALGIQSELGRGENALDISATMAGITDEAARGVWNAARRARSGLARSFGQDLMRGEGTNVLPGQRNLTWVKGDRDPSTLDETSRKNLAAGRKQSTIGSTPGRAADESGGSGWDGTWVKRTLGEDYTGLAASSNGTSIFDPVLCELVYRWFCPEGGSVLDPFAGGSVRGVVASLLGRSYTGVDLRPEQIAANEEQAGVITPDAAPRWIVGDSRDVGDLAPGEYDLIFSCPPYADLEVYSDDPRDISTMEYAAFLEAYRAIICTSVAMLRENRFAVFVVGDVRDKKGFYRNFVGATVEAFQDAGAILYNEAILVTAAGSLPIRIAKQFEGYRKLGKTHQNVLAFFKGDPRKIKDFGPVEMGEPLAQEGSDGD